MSRMSLNKIVVSEFIVIGRNSFFVSCQLRPAVNRSWFDCHCSWIPFRIIIRIRRCLALFPTAPFYLGFLRAPSSMPAINLIYKSLLFPFIQDITITVMCIWKQSPSIPLWLSTIGALKKKWPPFYAFGPKETCPPENQKERRVCAYHR